MVSFVQFNPIFGAKSPIFENHKEHDKMLKNGSFYPRPFRLGNAEGYCRRPCVCPSVCLSVCPSVRYIRFRGKKLRFLT